MTYNFLVFVVLALFASVFIAVVLKEFRHPFQVQEGHVGLLYHRGKFVQVLSVGRRFNKE